MHHDFILKEDGNREDQNVLPGNRLDDFVLPRSNKEADKEAGGEDYVPTGRHATLKPRQKAAGKKKKKKGLMTEMFDIFKKSRCELLSARSH